MAGRREAARRLVVERLADLAQAAARSAGRRARTWKGRWERPPENHRARAGKLCTIARRRALAWRGSGRAVLGALAVCAGETEPSTGGFDETRLTDFSGTVCIDPERRRCGAGSGQCPGRR